MGNCISWVKNLSTKKDSKANDGKKKWKKSEKDKVKKNNAGQTSWLSSEDTNLTPTDISDENLTKYYKVSDEVFKDQNKCMKQLGYSYHIENEIGHGGFGSVLKVTQPANGPPLACKIIKLYVPTNHMMEKVRKKQLVYIKNELFVLVKAKHANIVTIRDHFIINDNFYIIMEFANRGNLSQEVKRKGALVESVAKTYFVQIANAIDYMHNQLGFAHKDLKLANVLIFDLVDGKRVLKVTDFGISRVRLNQKYGLIHDKKPAGTVSYMSPQVLELYIKLKLFDDEMYGTTEYYDPFAADIWSLGICLYYMLTARYPFQPVSKDPRLLKRMLDDQRKGILRISKQFKSKLSAQCSDMLMGLLDADPLQRYTINSIKIHKFYS